MNPAMQKLYEEFFEKYPYISRICAADTETTGFGNDARIIEIGAAGFEFDGLSVKYIEFNSLINPHMPIPEKITEITHITDDMVANAPEDDVVFKDFEEWLQGMNVIIMHNSSFDTRIFRHNYQRVGMNFNPWESKIRCTLQMSKAATLPLTSMKLGEIAGHFKYQNEQAHRALYDALATLHIYAHLS